ncbi:MAG: hypothetical protein U0414_23775 [Polyangiaceae bacterium]
MKPRDAELGAPPQGMDSVHRVLDAATLSLEIGARAKRLRALVVAVLVVFGVAIGAAGYALLRAYFLARSGMSSPIAAGTLSLLPALAGSLFLARWVGPRVVSLRKPAWVAEVARRHGVDPAELEELTSLAGR